MAQQLRRLLNVVVLALVAIVVWNEWRSRRSATAITTSGVRQPATAAPSIPAADSDSTPADRVPSEPEGLVLPSPLGTPTADESDDDSLPAVGRAAASEATDEVSAMIPATDSAPTAPARGPGEATGTPLQAQEAATDNAPLAGAVTGDGTAECPDSHPVKGNASSMIYHEPGRASYARTIPEFCFATAEDAEAAGYRAPQR